MAAQRADAATVAAGCCVVVDDVGVGAVGFDTNDEVRFCVDQKSRKKNQ